MVEQPSNKQVEQRKETSATARRRFPPTPRLPSPSSTPATYTVALELVCEALDGLRNHARAGRTGCAQRPRRLDFAPGHTGPLSQHAHSAAARQCSTGGPARRAGTGHCSAGRRPALLLHWALQCWPQASTAKHWELGADMELGAQLH